ncbi:MAG TPA: S1 RNA-binding domain-containing protein [Gelria sp.]|nr:S1 RNA-binding domain-containing protein [Gelria sp.]
MLSTSVRNTTGGRSSRIEDITPGMFLTGTVRNVVDFGSFVDIGIKNDGLVHISQMADRYIRHPMEVVAVGDVVTVRVLSVDRERGKVALSMKTG